MKCSAHAACALCAVFTEEPSAPEVGWVSESSHSKPLGGLIKATVRLVLTCCVRRGNVFFKPGLGKAE